MKEGKELYGKAISQSVSQSVSQLVSQSMRVNENGRARGIRIYFVTHLIELCDVHVHDVVFRMSSPSLLCFFIKLQMKERKRERYIYIYIEREREREREGERERVRESVIIRV